MSKQVAYSVVGRKNLQKKDEPAKFYAQAQSKGRTDVDDMSARMEKKCTLHAADVAAVFKALEDEILESLERGEIVELGRIGTLQIGLESEGAPSREKFRVHMIKSVHLNFRPGKRFENMYPQCNFERVSRRGYADLIIPITPDDEKPAKEDPAEPV